MRKISSVLICVVTAGFASTASAQEIDWKKVDEALGRTAAVSGDVHRYGFPRTDLQVTLDGVTIRPTLALGGWAAFKPMPGGAMVMGDLVLLETEINPVMAKLIGNGLEVTAVHNHVLRSSPLPFYMHIGGHGDPVKLATAIRTALAESKTPLTPPAPPATPPAVDLDTAQLDQIIGVKGQANGGVYQFAVPRRDPVSENGMQLTPPRTHRCGDGNRLPAHRRRQGRRALALRLCENLRIRHGQSPYAACSTNGEPRNVFNQTSQSLPPFALLAVSKTLMTDTFVSTARVKPVFSASQRF
jgi:hypothetical protein